MDSKVPVQEAVGKLLENAVQNDFPVPANLSEDAIELLYTFGYGFYNSGNYDKAMHFFRYLTLLDHLNRKHWIGLGASYQMLKQYERALQCYGQAAILDETDPYAHWHAAECFLAINKVKEAKQALASAEITAKRFPDMFRTLLERIQLTKTVHPDLQHKKKNKSKRR